MHSIRAGSRRCCAVSSRTKLSHRYGASRAMGWQDQYLRRELGDGTVIAILEPDQYPAFAASLSSEQNIFRLDRDGSMMWQVRPQSGRMEHTPFTAIDMRDGQLLAWTWNGYIYILDEETG